jgi:LacI family transcriptional regulator
MASRGRRKSVGVVEMARDLGVSTATASRALNGSPSVRRELAELGHTEIAYLGAPPRSSQ